ncbi:RNA polymerase sigma factor [Chitinophaga niabensis]|uniref:RNA polymerase sigma-70 factor, ECF subfamily n=1 Tax=Chitinophaga niabensis TaxID=536979 RepID=A0A1N6DJR2_9BACT|nr:sigma-70 family RNA polymerase sigma factor [Chitinophaga niabensis]SIN70913.1 RNA polymerase sigma-70 factor, ECF subfamily [Chitinophaga niabensis]
MENGSLLPHLFRTEYRKIVSVLCKRFGFEQIEIAEDIASDTFLTATQAWGLKGLPENPTAWLYNVAKNKAKNYLQRSTFFEDKISAELKNSSAEITETDLDLSPQNINDSQLQMMFTICHPAISGESQIGLSLRILCGFGIEEIADAFLTSKETINKRLFRAKEKLREEGIKMAFPGPAEIEQRLEAVLTTIYLLFNEGYTNLRKEICLEAMRLCIMLVENNSTNTPPVNALLALMCFHVSRFEARSGTNGELILYEEQDTGLWNTDLISKGAYFLRNSASGKVTKYHLEAGIAYWHTQKEDTKEKWESILQNYNRLLQIAYSPIAALNRTYALSKANGKPEAIQAAEKLELTDHHLYYALLGELYTEINNTTAKAHFAKAISMAKNKAEKEALQRKMALI